MDKKIIDVINGHSLIKLTTILVYQKMTDKISYSKKISKMNVDGKEAFINISFTYFYLMD